MAKKKREPEPGLLKKLRLELSEKTRRQLLAVFLFAISVIFMFSFFGQAGAAGQIFFEGTQMLMGKAVFLLPFFLILGALILWGMRKHTLLLMWLGLLLLIVGVTGVLGVLADNRTLPLADGGGWIGFLVSWPLIQAFGFWVSEMLFAVLIVIAGVLFWQRLPHEDIEGTSFVQGARDKAKKIFEPTFDIEEVDPSPKMPQDDSGKDKKKGKNEELLAPVPQMIGDYKFPDPSLLESEKGLPNAGDVKVYSAIIKKTLANFDISVEISEVNIGPAVTQYAFKPAEGIKLSRIVGLQNDLSLALAAHPIRIEAPIPGRALVGIEIPNKVRAIVRLRKLLEATDFQISPSRLLAALGRDVSGAPVFVDLARMPHTMVAGATGSGKTIALSNIILSLVVRNSPDTLRFILVDPKRVEFPVYNDLPHLLTPVILDTQRALNALKWATKEMERRYDILETESVRDIASYHKNIVAPAFERFAKNKNDAGADLSLPERMPYIVVVIDELADIMSSYPRELEAAVVRLAQMSRAVGIHLILSTQRPSVNVITGLIKANIPTRIALQVSSQIDSRTILDMGGAEKLLGAGDMLYLSGEMSKPRRIQAPYISETEVKNVVKFLARSHEHELPDEIDLTDVQSDNTLFAGSVGGSDDEDDDLYEEAKQTILDAGKGSTSYLQRKLKVGYARAARLMDLLEERGVIGAPDGSKPREVLIKDEYIETEDDVEDSEQEEDDFR